MTSSSFNVGSIRAVITVHYQAKVGLVCSTGGYVSNSILDNYDGISPATGY